MKTLWFKGRYVEPILAGEKTDTLRQRTRLREGEHVALTVGPRPAFAHALIERIEAVADLPVERIAEAEALVGELGPDAVHIVFRLTGSPAQ